MCHTHVVLFCYRVELFKKNEMYFIRVVMVVVVVVVGINASFMTSSK